MDFRECVKKTELTGDCLQSGNPVANRSLCSGGRERERVCARTEGNRAIRLTKLE